MIFCPKCRKPTMRNTPAGERCSSCGYMPGFILKDGPTKCPICKKYSVYNGKCRNCFK